IPLPYQIFMGQALATAVAPFLTRPFVQPFRKSFGQPVCERFRHDGVVIVMVFFDLRTEFLKSSTGGHCEGTNVIRDSRRVRRNEVRESQLELALRFADLLPEGMKCRNRLSA